MSSTANSLQRTRQYHQRTKHHLQVYARSPGYLDWATQPDPFRRFEGAPLVALDHPQMGEAPCYDALFSETIAARALKRQTVSQLCYDSLALSAWKQASPGSRWSLRVNPSSGDLHPTEGYLICGAVEGLSPQPGIYHYAPFEHALEQRALLSQDEWTQIAAQLPQGAILIALTSIYWRESWKYGERAFRYCHHDVGHAIGTVAIAAAVLGWRTRLITSIADDELAMLLGIHHQEGMEAEHPDCLLAVYPSQQGAIAVALQLPSTLIERLAGTALTGIPNRLSRDHHPWPIIDDVSAATRYQGQMRQRPESRGVNPGKAFRGEPRACSARRLIHQRRSAVAMDGHTRVSRASFYHLLARVSPKRSPFPYHVLPWRPRISLALFVHRVDDLSPGLYLLIRDPEHRDSLQGSLSADFLWQELSECPQALDLYLLAQGNARQAAKVISCHQDIASDGAFCLGMLAQFEASLEQGPWFYPRLFWESGLIGQVLYLEAQAAGIRATGIGCFFDDAMHQLLGIGDSAWQSLYHFTVGGAVDDPRLKTLHPYFHKGKE